MRLRVSALVIRAYYEVLPNSDKRNAGQLDFTVQKLCLLLQPDIQRLTTPLCYPRSLRQAACALGLGHRFYVLGDGIGNLCVRSLDWHGRQMTPNSHGHPHHQF